MLTSGLIIICNQKLKIINFFYFIYIHLSSYMYMGLHINKDENFINKLKEK